MIFRGYRWHFYFDTVSDVTCPSGHPFKTVETWGDNDLICDHKGADGREDCGRRIYLAPMLRYRAKPQLVAYEVSATEMHHLATLKDPDEILTFLGLKKRKAA